MLLLWQAPVGARNLLEGFLFSFISSFNLQILPRSRSTDSYPETHFGLNTEEVVGGQSCNLINSEKLKKYKGKPKALISKKLT